MSGSARPWLPALAALAMLAGCSRQAPVSPHAEWVIHSRIVFLMQDLTTARAALPLSQFRLVFPYIAGDLYGAPTTGDFVQPVLGADYRLDMDLNASLPALLVSLEPTDFSLPNLTIEPSQARIARLAPMALEPDGIEQVGRVEWVDSATRQPLMLLYVDRAARLSGEIDTAEKPLRYDLRMAAPGYYWVARQTSQDGDIYRVVPWPSQVLLAITPLK